MKENLNETDIKDLISNGTIKTWSYNASTRSIIKQFKFKNFVEAMGWVNKVSLVSEKMNHHPDIHISYNKIEIKLTTHDANGITIKDIQLAEKIEKLNI